MRDGMKRVTAVLALGLCLTGTARAQVAAPPRLMIDGPEEVMFDPKRDACDGHDVPDVPPRLYRDAAGKIRLFTLHFENRALIGDSLDTLKLDCRVVYRGTHAADPAAYDDKSWIAAT